MCSETTFVCSALVEKLTW